MDSWQFDSETAVSPKGDGSFTTQVSSQWNIGDNPNGGYLLSSVLRAMSQVSPHADPMTVTTHFLRPGSGNQAGDIEIDLVRTGRTLSTLRGRLAQGGKTRVEVIAAFCDLPSASDAVETTWQVEAPDMPDPDTCVKRAEINQGVDLPLRQRVDTRLHPAYANAGEIDDPVVSGWIRFADGRDPDPKGLAMFADAFPPALFGPLGQVGWVPTIELTVHVRRRPAPGWIKGRFETTDLADGRMIEDGLLWDSTGALVAHSRQVGLLLQTG